jgi:hypothetical protein
MLHMIRFLYLIPINEVHDSVILMLDVTCFHEIVLEHNNVIQEHSRFVESKGS